MRTRWPFFFGWCIFVSSLTAFDVVHLEDGSVIQGHLVSYGSKRLEIDMVLEARGVRGSSRRRVLVDRVRFVDFAPIAGEKEWLEKRAVPSGSWKNLWEKKKRFLGRPRSNAGEVGLRLAGSLLAADQGRKEAAGTALRLYERVLAEDWEVDRQTRARKGRIAALMALGRFEEAVAEAEKQIGATKEPPVLVESHFVLAESRLGQLRRLIEEHPRWEEDEEIRPVQQALYFGALDGFFHACLFHGSMEEEAARGLWKAVEVYRLVGEAKRAEEVCKDLVSLYPSTAIAKRVAAANLRRGDVKPSTKTKEPR
ncbi:MAG: hypothetical protein AAF514_08275 [Verrucomicrobiota bacterium]